MNREMTNAEQAIIHRITDSCRVGKAVVIVASAEVDVCEHGIDIALGYNYKVEAFTQSPYGWSALMLKKAVRS